MRSLSRIAEELAASAPALTTLLTGFNRLSSSEEMPKRRPVGRLRRRISTGAATRLFIGVWTFMTLAMIAVALVLGNAGHGAQAGAPVHGGAGLVRTGIGSGVSPLRS